MPSLASRIRNVVPGEETFRARATPMPEIPAPTITTSTSPAIASRFRSASPEYLRLGPSDRCRLGSIGPSPRESGRAGDTHEIARGIEEVSDRHLPALVPLRLQHDRGAELLGVGESAAHILDADVEDRVMGEALSAADATGRGG